MMSTSWPQNTLGKPEINFRHNPDFNRYFEFKEFKLQFNLNSGNTESTQASLISRSRWTV